MLIFIYSIILLGFSLYSYFLIDPNITFFNHPAWSWFLERVLQVGYYQRLVSWQIYLILIILLYIFHYFFTKNYQKFNPVKLAGLIAILLVLSYPFLSHDFLKYMFDAKILTFYHKNPYLFRPIDFSGDPWLRFMQWIHQSYRYGWTFLAIIIIPSTLSMGKFLLSFIFFKITFSLFYLMAVFTLSGMNKRWALIFATHPLILVEGLINGHNDLIGAALIILSIYWLSKKVLFGKFFLVLSTGIKYLTLPAIFLSKNKHSLINKLIFTSFLVLLFSLFHPFMSTLFRNEFLSWYFIVLLAFLPYYEDIILKLNPLFFGLLVSYYPFIRFGEWRSWNNIPIRHIIVIAFTVINTLLFIILPKWRESLLSFIWHK